MARLVEFPQDMEREVRFVEDTDPGQIIQATIDKLRAGEAPNTLMTAAALAISRSCELPPDNHGGPVHPIAGIHATHQLAGRLDGEWGFVPVIQSVALANKHIHSPDMGPTVMAAIEPVEDSGDVEAMLDAFAVALMKRQSRQAERLLVALIKTVKPGQILNAMLTVALPQNAFDDHFSSIPCLPSGPSTTSAGNGPRRYCGRPYAICRAIPWSNSGPVSTPISSPATLSFIGASANSRR